MQEIITEIYGFFTSEHFNFWLTAGLAVFAVVTKIVAQVQKTRNNFKLANYDAKVKAKEIELKALYEQNEVIKQESEKYKEYVYQCKQSVENISEALIIAFNNSNLNASAKILVEEKLKAVDKIIIEASEGASKIQAPLVETIVAVKEVVEPIVTPIIEEAKNYKRVR